MRTNIEPEGIPTDTAVHIIAGWSINSVDDYEAATRRVAELAGCLEDTPEERELVALVEAIAAWDLKHDDATAWS